MSLRKNKFLLLAVVLGGLAIFGAPTTARADFELRFSIDGGATFSAPVSGPIGAPLFVIVDGLNIIASSTSSTSSAFSSIDLDISGKPPAGLLDIVIQSTMAGVQTTPPPEVLKYTFGLTLGPAGAFTSEGWIDQSNQDFGGAIGGPGGTNIIADTGSKTAPNSGFDVFSGTVPYSATIQTTISFTSNGNNTLSQDSGFEITPAPAPATLLLLASGAPILGLGWLRRRKFKSSKV